jgi:hypothetical protein
VLAVSDWRPVFDVGECWLVPIRAWQEDHIVFGLLDEFWYGVGIGYTLYLAAFLVLWKAFGLCLWANVVGRSTMSWRRLRRIVGLYFLAFGMAILAYFWG